jgi:glycine C-acetyltransferase
MVDDSHAVGFLGRTGRGTHEYRDCMGRVDIITGTLGKALGGASGGYTSGKKEIIDLLRQRSRPYLFSNTLAPAIAAASLASAWRCSPAPPITARPPRSATPATFRAGIPAAGLRILPASTPSCR